VAACPSGAMSGAHFTDKQILAEIEGMLRGVAMPEDAAHEEPRRKTETVSA